MWLNEGLVNRMIARSNEAKPARWSGR